RRRSWPRRQGPIRGSVRPGAAPADEHPMNATLHLISRADLALARRLCDATEPLGPIPEALIEHQIACIGYGRRNEDLRLGWLTPRGREWLADVDSGGAIGAHIACAWEEEQARLFDESL